MSSVAAPPPEVASVALSLEGRVVFCREDRDEGIKGYQFREWIVHVGNAKPKPYISMHFRPRFMKCHRLAVGLFAWLEDADYRKEYKLAAGTYEPGWLGSERIQFMNEAEFPDLDDAEDRVYLRYLLESFFSKKEWATLKSDKRLVKRSIFFPWRKDRFDTPDRGIPAEILMNASWYDLNVTFELREDATVQVAEFVVAYTSRGVKGAAVSSPK